MVGTRRYKCGEAKMKTISRAQKHHTFSTKNNSQSFFDLFESHTHPTRFGNTLEETMRRDEEETMVAVVPFSN